MADIIQTMGRINRLKQDLEYGENEEWDPGVSSQDHLFGWDLETFEIKYLSLSRVIVACGYYIPFLLPDLEVSFFFFFFPFIHVDIPISILMLVT